MPDLSIEECIVETEQFLAELADCARRYTAAHQQFELSRHGAVLPEYHDVNEQTQQALTVLSAHIQEYLAVKADLDKRRQKAFAACLSLNQQLAQRRLPSDFDVEEARRLPVMESTDFLLAALSKQKKQYAHRCSQRDAIAKSLSSARGDIAEMAIEESADEVRTMCDCAEIALAQWEFDDARMWIEEASSKLRSMQDARREAQGVLSAARERFRKVLGTASKSEIPLDVPEWPDAMTTADLKRQAISIDRWVDASEEIIQKAASKPPKYMLPVVDASAVSNVPPDEHPNPRPEFIADPVVGQLVRGENSDLLAALAEPDSVSVPRYMERLRLLCLRYSHDDMAEVFSAFRPNVQTERHGLCAWLWNLADSEQSEVPPPVRPLVTSLCEALVAEGEPVVAWALNFLLLGPPATDAVLNALYLSYAKQGPLGRAHLLSFVSAWEIRSPLPPSLQQRSWTVALALVEAALWDAEDPLLAQRAADYVDSLIPAPEELRIALQLLLKQRKSATTRRPRTEIPAGATLDSLKRKLCDNIEKNRSYLDRWKSEHVRSVEREYEAMILASFTQVEQARTAEQLDTIEVPEIRERKIRSRLRGLAKEDGSHRDPGDLGERTNKLIQILEEHCEVLRQIIALRHQQLSPACEADLHAHLKTVLPTLDPHQQCVALAILQPGPALSGRITTSRWEEWDPNWLNSIAALKDLDPNRLSSASQRRESARNILQQQILAKRDESQSLLGAAYFAALRGEGNGVLTEAEPDWDFVQRLRAYQVQARKAEIVALADWAEHILAETKKIGLSEPELVDLVATLRAAASAPKGFDLEHYEREVSVFHKRFVASSELQREAAELLAQEAAALPQLSALALHCIAVGDHALAEQRLGLAIEAFRATIALSHAPDSEESVQDAERLLSAHALPDEELAHPSQMPERQFEDEIRFLEVLLRQKRDAYFQTVDAELMLTQVRSSSVPTEEISQKLLVVRELLEKAPLLDEPTGFGERFVPAGLKQASPNERPIERTKYLSVLGDPPDFDRAVALLTDSGRILGGSRESVGYRALQAEWARVQALRHGLSGDFETARRFCEDLYFLQRRHGKRWSERRLSTPQPPDEPLLAVQVLFAANLLSRAQSAEQAADPAVWLAEKARSKGNFSPDALRRALQAQSVRDGNLSRLIGVMWSLPPDDSEHALIRSLHRMSLWEGTPGALGAMLAGQLRENSDANARMKLAFMLTNYALSEPDFGLSLLDQLVGAGQGELGRKWKNLRRHLDLYTRARHIQERKVIFGKLLELTLLVSSTQGRSYQQCVEGIRHALLLQAPPSAAPLLKVMLEEDLATTDGEQLEFVIALRNTGSELIHNIRITHASLSQVHIAGNEGCWTLSEPLTVNQTVVLRVPGICAVPEGQAAVSLGLKLTYMGPDDRLFEYLASFTLRRRRRDDLPHFERGQMLKMFTDSGVEVTLEGTNFFGRGTELQTLHVQLRDKWPPEPLMLEGMRRIGKTSLAKVFLRQAKQENDIDIFVDFKRYANHGGDLVPPWRVFGFLVTELLSSELARNQTLGTKLGFGGVGWREKVYQQFKDSLAPSQLLRDLLEHAAIAADERRILMVLDELDYFVNYWLSDGEGRNNVYDFFNVLRGLFSEQHGPLGCYRWLLCGSDRCSDMFGHYTNPLYGSIAKTKIKGVSMDECRQILRGPFARSYPQIQITEQVFTELYELTRGIPFFVQIIGNRLCSVLLEHPTDLVSRWHLRQAVARSMPNNTKGESSAPYDRLLEPLGDCAEQPLLNFVLALIAAHTTDEEPTVKFDDILVYSEQYIGSRLSSGTLHALLQRIEGYQIIQIRPQGKLNFYEISFPLVRQLLQAKYEYSIPVVKEAAVRYLDMQHA